MQRETVAALTMVFIFATAMQFSCAHGRAEDDWRPDAPDEPLYLPADEFSYTTVSVEPADVPARFAADIRGDAPDSRIDR